LSSPQDSAADPDVSRHSLGPQSCPQARMGPCCGLFRHPRQKRHAKPGGAAGSRRRAAGLRGCTPGARLQALQHRAARQRMGWRPGALASLYGRSGAF